MKILISHRQQALLSGTTKKLELYGTWHTLSQTMTKDAVGQLTKNLKGEENSGK